MTELKKLLKQRTELDRRIKELQTTIVAGRCKLSRTNYTGGRANEWVITALVKGSGEPRYSRIIATESREQTISEIDELIKDLKKLKDEAERRFEENYGN